MLPIAYTLSYGYTPNADQIQMRIILYLVILSSPAFVVYAISKLVGYEARYAIFKTIIGIVLASFFIVPTVGPTPAWAAAVVVLIFCSSLELIRYEMLGKFIGIPCAAFALFGMYHVVPGALPHYLMTGRI